MNFKLYKLSRSQDLVVGLVYFSRDGTEWVCDQENISIHFDAGAPGDVIVEVTLAAGALYPRVRHSCRTAHNLNY